jgi:hypothetical protein
MATSKVYERNDFVLRIVPGKADAQITLQRPLGPVSHASIEFDAFDQAARGETSRLAAAVRGLLPGSGLVDAPNDGFALARLCLQLGRREWAGIDWEAVAGLQITCFVRHCPVRPRIAQIPLTFPIRMLEVGREPTIGPALENVFHGADHRLAVLNAIVAPDQVEGHPVQAGWPTVDVLHLGEVASASITTERWLPVFLDHYQTRLLVMTCQPGDLARLLQWAQMLVERGGPAVFVSNGATMDWRRFYADIVHDRPLDWIRAQVRNGALFGGAQREELLRYSVLAQALSSEWAAREILAGIREGPLRPRFMSDADLRGLARQAVERAVVSLRVPRVSDRPSGPKTAPDRLDFSYFDQPRRSRFSSLVAVHLADRGVHSPVVDRVFDLLLDPQDQSLDGRVLSRAVASVSVPIGSMDNQGAISAVQDKLRAIDDMQRWLAYEDQESLGMLPLAAKVADTRALVRGLRRAPGRPSRARRHVNAAFFAEDAAGKLEKLSPTDAQLRAGREVHLGVQIGPRDRLLASVGSTALLEEVEQQGGAWLEVGVTAYDFELIGDPVQGLLLPKTGESALALFALRVPMSTPNPGVARVRLSIYLNNNVVQSFLVAARVIDGADLDASGDADTNLARVLGIRRSRLAALGHPRYVTRLEYRASAIDATKDSRPRALSIVANDNAGQKVLTFKGDELFYVTTPPDLAFLVQNLRDALARASQDARQQYRYTHGNELNRGDPDDLLAVLWDVALTGWQLFDQLIPGQAAQQDVLERLASDEGLHAAHIDIANVIPWAMIYDRPVRDRKELPNPADPKLPPLKVTKALCRAADQGLDRALKCGRTGCLLHPDENKRRQANGEPLLCEETVICPQRFWGFRVPIEVPVQQVQGVGGKPPPAIRTQIATAKPLVFVAAFNPNLDKAMLGDPRDGMHGDNLSTLTNNAGAQYVLPPRPGRDPVIDLLATQEPDVVYLYCHGVSGATSKSGRLLGDTLDFGLGHQGQTDDLIEGADFIGPDWGHGPLVFLNGCSTVGFKAYAPSAFIKKFIQGRKASAVIGTEVVVWEALAREFAETYFASMLSTRKPGRALLEARRALLDKHNPLGLAYTLFGSLDLKA